MSTMNYLMMAIATPSANNPVAPGTVLTVDAVSARTMPRYFAVEISGPTAQRPAVGVNGVQSLPCGTAYYDTTLASTIYWDGASWRNGAGTAV